MEVSPQYKAYLSHLWLEIPHQLHNVYGLQRWDKLLCCPKTARHRCFKKHSFWCVMDKNLEEASFMLLGRLSQRTMTWNSIRGDI